MMRISNKTRSASAAARSLKKLELILLGLLSLTLLLLPAAQAQQAQQLPRQQQTQQQPLPTDPQAQQPFTLKIDTQLVVQNVIVKDKDGKNITGLTKDDFVLTEDNVPQSISVFQYERLDDTPVPALAATPAPVQLNVVQAPSATNSIAPSPAAEGRYRDRRLLVLFFDMANTAPADQLRAFT